MARQLPSSAPLESIESLLLGAIQQLPLSPDAWPWSQALGKPVPVLEDEFEELDLQFAYEADLALELWIETQSWQGQDISPELAGFLHARLFRAHEWLATFRVRGCTALSLCVDRAEFLRWLLIDWWETHGRTAHVHGLILIGWGLSFPEE